ncbi:unnamed protein product, partial [Rhizoctonia solani]
MSYQLPEPGLYYIKFAKEPRFLRLTIQGSRALVIVDETQNQDSQKWNVTPVPGMTNEFRITSYDSQYTLTWGTGGPHDQFGHGYLQGKPHSITSTTWIVEPSSSALKIWNKDKGHQYCVDCCGSTSFQAHFWWSDPGAARQHWAFIPVNIPAGRNLPSSINSSLGTGTSCSFQNQFFDLSVERAALQTPGQEYDIIIVGSGIGGGVLANDLYDTNLKLGGKAKRILLLEKGGLVFHSHCLNTARPAGLANDRGQQNDTFFHRFKEDYRFNPTQKDWSGGAMYNLGGRSAAWGLFAPRVHDQVLIDHFHPRVARELLTEYYDKAERLMLLSLPTTRRIHQHIMDRLNIDGLTAVRDSKVQWQWGRIASEFHDDRNFDFAAGAYSTIDKILEIAMSWPPKKTGVDGRESSVNDEHFKTVLNADVRSLILDSTKKVTGVKVRTAEGKMVAINVKPGGSVVLCAGSVHSPAILLRSDPDFKRLIRDRGGLRLTDHDILYFNCAFRFRDANQRSEYGAMKLQTYVDIGDGHIALANMSIDASSFLPRGGSPDDNLPKFIMVFILQQKLIPENNIRLEDDEPVVTMTRGPGPSSTQMETMQKVTATAMQTLVDSVGLRFVGFPTGEVPWKKISLSKLPLGGVAHELGTLPMEDFSGGPSCLDVDLRVKREICDGVYVCDLSCFPYSPESNPTLTLAALAIRLSRSLNQRLHVQANDPNVVYVANHSGFPVKVWLSNYRPDGESGTAENAIELGPGKDTSWKRV